MARIGIYGGTFDPVHTGHIRGASYALQALELDTLFLIPAGIPPHKDAGTVTASARQRLEMLRLAVAEVPGLEVSEIELLREGVSYTWQTVAAIRERYPEDSLFLLMGEDMFLTVDSWKNPQLLFQETTVAVLCRGERKEQVAAKAAELKDKVPILLLENPVDPISSTQLRRMLAFHCGLPLLPPAVAAYIQQNDLYCPDYRGLSLKGLEEAVTGLLNPNRVKHTLGCRDTAAALARRWGADETDAARAGLLHDVTKALDGPLQLTLCRGYGILLDEFSLKNPKTLHALTGSLVAERIFGENEKVVSAICSHTTGKPNMNILEKIIYVADYMEPNRDFPGVERLRELADTDIDKALQLGLEMTLEMLKKQGRQISPESSRALEYLKETTQKG